MIFAWNDWNIRHIAQHGVTPDEAEYVVTHARRPYPLAIDAEKRLIVGSTKENRQLHVIFVVKSIDDVEPNSVSLADLHDERLVIEVIFIIHAMPASTKQKRHDRRRRMP